MVENTFLGLQPYTEDDAYRFKGRAEESLELFRNIERNDITVCYAESGEGKTSLLNAGVFPLLRGKMYFPISITFTSDDYKSTPDSFDTIIDRCIKDSIAEYNDKNKGVNVEYRLCSTDFQDLACRTQLQQELSKYSWWKLRNYKPQAMGLTFTAVFVFDQFEEVFNMPGSIVWTKKFFDWLENVASDSCPDEIIYKVREIIGSDAAFPAIREDKKFKSVFSLRKEYIGELDYWGMQKCFIPSLKENRYCLKALTYEGAKKVMMQQELFDENKVKRILTYLVRQYSREPEKTINEDLPVIPALLLSVVCDSWEKDIEVFTELNANEIGHSLNSVLERFFNKAIDTIVQELSEQETNVNPDQYRYDLETAVFALVDGNGKRVRTKTTNPSLTQIDFDSKYKQALSRHRIIKVTKVDGEDYVEIVHDSLCPVIAERKEIRIKEIKEQIKQEKERNDRLKEQREEFLASFITIPLAVLFSLLFSKVFQDYDKFANLKAFGTTFILVIANLSVLPLLLYTAIKKYKISFWLSVYAIISNLILMFFFLHGQETEQGIRYILAGVSIGIPILTMIYAIKLNLLGVPEKKELRRVLTSIPILLFFWIISCFVFYLCVFNKTLELPEPFNSSWGIFVISLLTYEITCNACACKQNKIAFVFLCCLWGLLTYNTSVEPFALPSYMVIGIMVGIIALLIRTFKDLSLGKRIMAVLFNFVVLTFVVILNMGFAVNRVNYDSVSHVYNWVDVVVHNQDNKVGVVSASSGDTILPCVFDSIDYRRQHFVFLNSNKLHYAKDIKDYTGWLSYMKTNDATFWQCLFIDEVENTVSKYKNMKPDTTRSDSLQVYAARVYHEVRNANISYFINGEMYNLSEIPTLDTLAKIQANELADILKQMSNSATKIFSKPIDITQVTDFNKAFARLFYLCMLKDRILQKDSVDVFSLPLEMIKLYFLDNGKFEWNVESSNNITINGFHKTVSCPYNASGLRNNKLDSWYNYIITLLAMDMASNAESYVNKKVSKYDVVLANARNLYDRVNMNLRESDNILKKISELSKKGDKLGENELKNVLGLYIKQIDSANVYIEQTNTVLDQVDQIEIEMEQMELVFQKLINDVFTTLSQIVLNSQNIYNSEFIDICEQLYVISVLRQYKIAPIYRQYLEQMGNSRNPIYVEFEKIQQKEDSLKQMAKNYQLQLVSK